MVRYLQEMPKMVLNIWSLSGVERLQFVAHNLCGFDLGLYNTCNVFSSERWHNATFHPFGILRHHWLSMFTFLFTFLFTWKVLWDLVVSRQNLILYFLIEDPPSKNICILEGESQNLRLCYTACWGRIWIKSKESEKTHF